MTYILDGGAKEHVLRPNEEKSDVISRLRNRKGGAFHLKFCLFELSSQMIFTLYPNFRAFDLRTSDCLVNWALDHHSPKYKRRYPCGIALDHGLTVGFSKHVHLLYCRAPAWELWTFDTSRALVKPKRVVRLCPTATQLVGRTFEFCCVLVVQRRLFISSPVFYPRHVGILELRLPFSGEEEEGEGETESVQSASLVRIIDVPDPVLSMALLEDERLLVATFYCVYSVPL